ncbi:MAG: hypothetical protein ABI851_11415 [Saprospiraceae bacterium]
MKVLFNNSVLIILGILTLQSCRREDQFENSFTSTSYDLTTQQNLLEANELEINYQIENGFKETSTRSFPTRSWANPKNTYPNTLTIDYGKSGVTGPYGHIRRGVLVVQISAPIYLAGSVRIVNHNNFYIDDVKVEGTVILSNQGKNSNNQNLFYRDVLNRKLIFPSGKSIEWNSNQSILQIEGNETEDFFLDDVWSIVGSSHGINRFGNEFSTQTINPLIYAVNCLWLVEGVFSITNNGDTYKIDYGNGDCNNIATLYLPNGDSKEINLNRWW